MTRGGEREQEDRPATKKRPVSAVAAMRAEHAFAGMIVWRGGLLRSARCSRFLSRPARAQNRGRSHCGAQARELWSARFPPAHTGPCGGLGRSQAVRQRILIPPYGGSNPPAPANDYKDGLYASERQMSAPCRHGNQFCARGALWTSELGRMADWFEAAGFKTGLRRPGWYWRLPHRPENSLNTIGATARRHDG
jgi:hypothetical protein